MKPGLDLQPHPVAHEPSESPSQKLTQKRSHLAWPGKQGAEKGRMQ